MCVCVCVCVYACCTETEASSKYGELIIKKNTREQKFCMVEKNLTVEREWESEYERTPVRNTEEEKLMVYVCIHVNVCHF